MADSKSVIIDGYKQTAFKIRSVSILPQTVHHILYLSINYPTSTVSQVIKHKETVIRDGCYEEREAFYCHQN